MKHFFKKYWAILILLGFVVLLFVTNYRPGTILSGWDNLHPEFDFGLNIKRSIFAVWQEYQGLGLLGGMAHSTDLLRQIFLFILSLFLPNDSLRYIWTFLMLFTGSVGSYFLIKYVLNFRTLRKLGEPENQTRQTVRHSDSPASEYSEFSGKENANKLIPFLGASFYLLNLATIQMFYVPFESFIGFFGFLPWVLLSSIIFFRKPVKKNLLFLVLILLIATPAWYLQTVFIVFIIALSIILLPSLLNNFKPGSIIKLVKLYGIIFLVNSFWLLPATYFTLTNSDVNLNSKINQMATETIFLQNKEFGTLPDVMLLKGFMFKGVDPNAQGNITYMLKPWSDHLNNPFVAVAGLLLFAVVFIGFIKAIRTKNPALQGFALLFIFSFIALAVDTPPFSFINSLLRNNIRVLNQIFRFPFTKFATLASLVYAILFAVGIQTVVKKLELRIKNQELRFSNRKYPFLLLTSCFLLLIIFALPVFQGHLFYDKERVIIPTEYKQLFAFFKSKDPNTRIANFPQSNFWGWSFYNWLSSPNQGRPGGDYGGSGFLWYGIKQPILDRAFDVWSTNNENYYFEITQALYSKNNALFEKVLNKYQINWLLVDKNIFDSSSSKALFIPELEELLANSSLAKKEASFGKLQVYKINLTDKPKNYVYMTKNLPVVNEYKWNNFDQAYFDNGNYISRNGQEAKSNSQTYPFRSLFTLKTQNEKEFEIKEEPASIAFINKLPVKSGSTLILPSFTQKEKIIPIHIKTLRTASGTPKIEAQVLLPQIIVGNRELQKNTGPVFQAQLPPFKNDQYPLTLNINGASYSPISNTDKDIGVAFFTLNSSNTITVSDKTKRGISNVVFPLETISRLQTSPLFINVGNTSNQYITVRFPKIDANYLTFRPLLNSADSVRNCDNFNGKSFSSKIIDDSSLTLSSLGATACTSFFAQNLPHDQSFAIFINSKNIQGQGLRFWVENTNQQSVPIDTYLSKEKNLVTSSFILPAMEQFGSSYAFHFYNSSIGRDKTVNEIGRFAAYPVFYNYLKSIKITAGQNTAGSLTDTSKMDVSHPNESKYVISMENGKWPVGNNTTLVLSQSFNPGWKAYAISNFKCQMSNFKCAVAQAFPFIFGKEIKNHVMVNNWENGWVLSDPQMANGKWQMVIVYTPQYLEYLGFGLLILTLFGIIIRSKFSKT